MDKVSPPTKTPKQKPSQEDHDSPSKEALEVFFKPFIDFLYPQIAELIDWQQLLECGQEDELNLWTERVLFAETLEAVFVI